MLSCIVKFQTGNGLVFHLHGPVSFAQMINTAAIKQVADTIGFGSILFGWMYAALDKEELGLKYGDLLLAVYPAYHKFVLAHLAAIFACKWLVEVGATEGALLALGIVMWGCIIQWKALMALIFRRDKRKRIAMGEWVRLADEQQGAELLSLLYRMADVISVQDAQHADKQAECFCLAMIRYIQVHPNGAEKTQVLRGKIMDASNLWDRLMCHHKANERLALLGLVLGNLEAVCCEHKQERGTLPIACAGFVLWQCRYHAEIRDARRTGSADVLIAVQNDIAFVSQRCREQRHTFVPDYLGAIYSLLIWLCFLCGDIPMRSDLFQLAYVRLACDESLEAVLRQFACCAFTEQSSRAHFEAAYRQVCGNEPRTDGPDDPRVMEEREEIEYACAGSPT